MADKILIDLHYLPSLEYFTCLIQADEITLEAHEHFIKQSYRNRCYIRDAQGKLMLNIPVLKGKSKTVITQVRIDNDQPWQRTHWRAIRAAYGNAPFFEHYAPYFEHLYHEKEEFLWSLNLKFLTLCLKFLKINTPVNISDIFHHIPSNGNIDLRSVIHPKQKTSKYSFYSPKSYVQVFGPKFVSNLSIIDLLCCEGPNARQVLYDSIACRNI